MKIFEFPTIFKNINSITKAGIILALIIIIAFSPIIFLNQTYSSQFPFGSNFQGYEGKMNRINTLDGSADYRTIRPVMMLGTDLIKNGTIPLWNPYMGGGAPLAADSINYIFSPTIFLFLIPVEFWDFGLLTHLWLAGLFMFLFLRSLGLNFTSSISGATLYMLSGIFVWFLPHTHIPVMVFTPLILYSLEKLIKTRELKFVVLTSIAICFGILGAHLESIILQLLLVVTYFVFRIARPLFLDYRLKHKNQESSTIILVHSQNTKKIIFWFIFALICGLGLSSFFIFPVYELTNFSALTHTEGFGLRYWDKLGVLFPFVPFGMGSALVPGITELTYIHKNQGLWGFVGILSLFFTILSIFRIYHNKNDDQIHKYTPLFFLGFAVFFMMKAVGVPIVNLFGTLPLFELIGFIRYSGVIISISFAVTAAFGIDWLTRCKVKKKFLAMACVISISVILILSIPLYWYLFEDLNEHDPQSRELAKLWVTFQIIQTGLFVLMAFLVCVAITQKKSPVLGLVFLIILELSLYIPSGLHYDFLFYKSIITLIGMAFVTFLTIKPN